MSDMEPIRVTEGLPDTDRLWEVIDGRLVEKPFRAFAAITSSRLGFRLAAFVESNGLGWATILLPIRTRSHPERRRLVDVAFLRGDEFSPENISADGEAYEAAPVLAVEVVDPIDEMAGSAERIAEYFRFGVERVWLIARSSIVVHDAPTSTRTLRRGDVLDGGDVIPGFRLAVSDLLPEPSRSESPGDATPAEPG